MYHSFFHLRPQNKSMQLVLFIILIELLFFPFPGFADKQSADNLAIAKIKQINSSWPKLTTMSNKIANNTVDKKKKELKQSEESVEKIRWSKRYTMTAYNSEVAQCDASPCITANGFNVCKHHIEDTVATNFLPFGTKIRIPELFGDRIFIVRDRMNKRYQNRIDVWLLHRDNAIDFGVKYPLVEVLQ